MRPRLTYANVVSTLCLFLLLGGGAAYAANTIDSSDVIDESLLSQDIKNAEVKLADIGQGAVATDEIANGQVKTADIGAGEVRSGNVANDNLTGGDIAANSLKGADIDESTLSSIGGGGPAGGDLTGSYPNPLIAPNAVGRDEVANNSLRGADIDESTLGRVPDADTLDSLDSTQLNPVAGDGRTADLPLSISTQTVLTATITTVRSAALDVSAAVEVTNTQTNTGGVTCYFQFDGFASSSPDFATYAVSLRETLPLVWVQGVEAGTHTVELRCSGATHLYVDDAGMSVSAHL